MTTDWVLETSHYGGTWTPIIGIKNVTEDEARRILLSHTTLSDVRIRRAHDSDEIGYRIWRVFQSTPKSSTVFNPTGTETPFK